MSQDYKETLYINLFNVLNELTEYESAEAIFDRIVEDFAMSTEYHMGKADAFKCMLDTFRHDNPIDTIPDEYSIDTDSLWGTIEDQLSPVSKRVMSGNKDEFLEFIQTMKFPN